MLANQLVHKLREETSELFVKTVFSFGDAVWYKAPAHAK